MIQLFLDNKETFPDAKTQIKIVRENPYFTLSDSYSLEVSLPLEIYENRAFFGNMGRIEKSKNSASYDAKLIVNYKTILKGKARITQSTNKDVKLLLTTGISALKMTAGMDDLYVDEMHLGTFARSGNGLTRLDAGYFYSDLSDTLEYENVYDDSGEVIDTEIKGRVNGWAIPLKDATNDEKINVGSYEALGTFLPSYIAVCPRLIDVAKRVAAVLGYSLDSSVLPEACRHIYIITGVQSHDVAKKLPHWSVPEFFDQVQNFFGCTIEETADGTLKMVRLESYADKDVTEISPSDEFEVEYSEENEAKGVINNNLEYSMNANDYEIVDDEILEQATETFEFSNYSAALNHFNDADLSDRMAYLYIVNGEKFIGWKTGESYTLHRIAPFNKLERYQGADTTTLKISPVHISENEECQYIEQRLFESSPTYKYTVHLPEVANIFGLINRYAQQESGSESYTLQGLVQGDEEVKGKPEKDDFISVAFLEWNNVEEVESYPEREDATPNRTDDIVLAYTDSSFKQQLANRRSRWSLSLNKDGNKDFYLGQLHETSFLCKARERLKVPFSSDEIPDAKNVFLIRNKRFACEKIEASITNGEIDNMMTGYFYEMNDIEQA